MSYLPVSALVPILLVALILPIYRWRRPRPAPAPWERAVSTEEVLANLPRVAGAGVQVEQNLAGWVRRARSLGATWARIGDALGMTRQSAWERFSGEG